MTTLVVEKKIENWVACAHQFTLSSLDSSPGQRVYLPAGQTPVPLYRFWNQNPIEKLQTARLLQIDEILTPEKRFRNFFEVELSSYRTSLEWIGKGMSQAQLAILGVGVNGHVGFHEPGLPRNLFSACVRLDPSTCQSNGIDDGSWGVTYGTGAFQNCKKILILARGNQKKAILRRALAGDESLPVSWLLNRPNTTLLTDFEID